MRPSEIEKRRQSRLSGLPQICSSRKCRRTNTCIKESMHCVHDHLVLLYRRWEKLSRQENDRKRHITS